MDFALAIYAIGIVGSVKTALLIFSIGSGIMSLVSFMWRISINFDMNNLVDYFVYSHDSKQFTDTMKPSAQYTINFCNRLNVLSITVFLLSTITATLLPSEKTAYMMAGAYAAQKISENPNVENMSKKILDILNQKLDNMMEESVEKVTKGSGK